MEAWRVLGDIVVLLAASLLIGGLFSRFGQSPIIGYLLAGMILGGPGSIRAVKSEHEIEAIAELGVALLLFSLGLEFSLDRVKKFGTKLLLGGIVQIALTVLVVVGITLPFGLAAREAVAVGAMVALSSTAVVLRILMERGEIETPYGRNSLAILLTQDMAVVPLALLMTILGGQGAAAEVAWGIGKLLLMAAGLTVVLFLFNKVAVLALGMLTLSRNRELTMVFAVAAGLGAAWASHSVGISPALGAFLAGMLLGNSAFATQVRADIAPLRVVLLTLFFGAAGMVADPIWILSNWYLVGAVVAMLTIAKLGVVWLILLALGQTVRVAAATGLCLAQVGEFAFVLGSIGKASRVVTEDTFVLIVSVAIVSFFFSTFLVPWAPRFGNQIARLFRSQRTAAEDGGQRQAAPEVAIIGFGPAGQIAAEPLIDKGASVTIIDLNQNNIRKAREMGFHGEVGDATLSEVLEHARLYEAKVIVITVPDHKSALTILQQVRRAAPHVHTIVRSRYELHAAEYVASGAHAVASDEQEVGERLATLLNEWLANEERQKNVNYL